MYPFRERLGNDFTTAGTLLRCAAWFNQNDCTTSIFRFACTALDELSPRGVGNTLVQPTMVPVLHVLNLKFFEGQQLKTVDELAAQLVGKVKTAVSNALVDVLYYALPFASLWRSLRFFVLAPLGFRQRFLITAKEAGICNRFTVRQRSKVCQAHVNANHLIRDGQRLRFHNAREAGIPLAEHVSANCQCLRYPLQLAVQSDSHITDFRKMNIFIADKLPVYILGICERIITGIGLETRVSWFFLTRVDTTKKSAKSQIYALLSILHRLTMTSLQPYLSLFPFSQHLVCVITAERFLPFFPGIAAHFQRLVIDPTAAIKMLLQGSTLCFRGKQTVLETLSHEIDNSTKYTQSQICVYVLNEAS